MFVATPDIWYSQLFFPIKGILVVYDTQTGSFKALPGADDPRFVQTNATWSPDGKSIVFARAEAYEKGVENVKSVLVREKDVPEFLMTRSRSSSTCTASRSTADRAAKPSPSRAPRTTA